jgi:alkylation response protein AidB-like acyl-CoA dehydrogenase
MNFDLTEEQKMIRDMAREFARKEIEPVAAKNEREGHFPKNILKKMAELGLMGVNIPQEYGGAESGVVAYSLALMEIARACASTAVTMSVTNMVAEIINQYGSEDLKKKYIPRITSGEYVAGAFALTEPHAGSDAGAIKTTAVKKGDKYILNGSKVFITSGAYAGCIIVYAVTDKSKGKKGISAFVVERGTEGLIIGKEEKKMGLKASNTVSLDFCDCAVPASNLLATEGKGFEIAMTALNGGRIGIASQAVGIADAALDAAIRYSLEREAFGKKISEFQAIQFKIADCATQLDAARLLTLRAAFLKEKKRSYTKEASMAKLFSTEVANRICAEAIQIHGGYGYIEDYNVERYYRDVRVTTIYEGTSEIQRIVIAREILKNAG